MRAENRTHFSSSRSDTGGRFGPLESKRDTHNPEVAPDGRAHLPAISKAQQNRCLTGTGFCGLYFYHLKNFECFFAVTVQGCATLAPRRRGWVPQTGSVGEPAGGPNKINSDNRAAQ